MKRLEYSQIARRKIKALRIRLTNEYGSAVSNKIIKQITSAARGLESFEDYRIEDDKVIVAEIFDEREDFMYKLFGITTTSQDSIEYWDE